MSKHVIGIFLCVSSLFLCFNPLFAQDIPATEEIAGQPVLVQISEDLGYHDYFAQTLPEGNVLLAVLVTPEVAEAMSRQEDVAVERYALITGPQDVETMEMTPELFEEVKISIKDRLPVLSRDSQIQAYIEQLSAQTPEVQISEPLMLGIDFEMPHAIAYSSMTTFQALDELGNTILEYWVSTVLNVLQEQKLLYVTVYSFYEDEASLEWTRQVARAWADNLA